MVDSNHSFASSTDDGDCFRKMFSDSEIAKNYRQSETKMKYVIQYGIAPHMLSSLKDNFQDMPFTFKFDKSTTTQVKKQYDGYIQNWSKTKACITTAYCGSLFAGNSGPSERN